MSFYSRVGDIPDCKMPLSNLAKVFGPTIIGYSVPDPEPLQMINETKYQSMVSISLTINNPPTPSPKIIDCG